MKSSLLLVFPLFLCFHYSNSLPPILGLHPLDESYYEAEVIKCRDGSKSFTRDRLNDDFCDCPDGTDEPGTSACPAATFYCRNKGSTPRFLFSSRVNDHICDCCDGSDEYDGIAHCPNTCIMGGNIVYQSVNYDTIARIHGSDNSRKTKSGSPLEDSLEKLLGLKALILIQVALIFAVVAFRLFRKRKTRRRISR